MKEVKDLKPSPQPNASWAFEVEKLNAWAYWDEAFTPEECDQIIKTGTDRLLTKATVSSDLDVRESDIAWLYSVDDMEWAYRRMTDIITSLNDQFFKFDLSGMIEGFQFTRYVAPTGRYEAHIDRVTGGLIRKLSFTLQLSDPAEYTGGDLLLHTAGKPETMKRDRGHVVVFPSYTLHEVTPVTKGTRYSLVSWVTGKPFK